MHADLSRVTFRPGRHYSSVVSQQGRVQLDSDANEQAAIQLHYARTLAADLIGQHGGPRGATGFKIAFQGGNRELDDLTIGGGRYYVDGILCDATRPLPGVVVDDEAPGGHHDHEDAAEGKEGGQDGGGAAPAPPATWTYWDQPDAYRDRERNGDRLPTGFPFLVYLKVWERTVTAAEDPDLREVALGAAMPDTAARTKVVWQVLPLEGSELDLEDGSGAGDRTGDSEGEGDGGSKVKESIRDAFARWVEKSGARVARLAARSERPDRADDDPCLVRPDARYRGPENQLYRVEVHDGGTARDATFKWSRENGSVVFPVDAFDGTWAELASPGGDDKLDLNVGDWVEPVDTAYASRDERLPLLRVEEVDLPGRRVRLSAEPDPAVGRRPELRPCLRRWDHQEGSRRGKGGAARLRHGAVRVEEGRWLPLEDGVEVYFAADGTYRSGDYWLVPARTATGSVEWPVNAARKPLLQAPAGIRVSYAPLAWIYGEGSPADLRQTFEPLAGPVPAADARTLAAEAAAMAETEAREKAAEEGAAGADPGEGTGAAAAEQ